MSKKTKLTKRLIELNLIITQVVQLRDYIIKYQNVKKEILEINPENEFTIIRSLRSQFHINMSMLIINLYKLCDPKFNESYNLNKIYNCLFNEFKNQIKIDKSDRIKLVYVLYHIKHNKRLIDNISIQRNKFYAHRDLNIDSELSNQTEIDWKDIFHLIDKLCLFVRIIKFEFINEGSFNKSNFIEFKDHILYYNYGHDINGHPLSIPETIMNDLSLSLDFALDFAKKKHKFISNI